MKIFFFTVIAFVCVIIPTLSFADDGEFTITTPPLMLSKGAFNLITEYGLTQTFGLGLEYGSWTVSSTEATWTKPYVRYYFSGDGDSYFVSVGYMTLKAASGTLNAPTAELGRNWDWNLMTVDLGIEKYFGQTETIGGGNINIDDIAYIIFRVGAHF